MDKWICVMKKERGGRGRERERKRDKELQGIELSSPSVLFGLVTPAAVKMDFF